MSESTELPLEERDYTGPARRSRVLARRGERERDTEKGVSSPRLDSTPRPARSRARACDGEEERTIGERERTQLSLFDVSLFVIALEGTPERRRRRRTSYHYYDDLRAGEITR